MKFNINKDFLTEYGDDIYKGLSGRELISLITGGLMAGGAGYLAWKEFGVSPDTAVYIGMPFAAPFVIIPNLRFQGYMSVRMLLQEMAYQKHCEELSLDGVVEPEGFLGSMDDRHYFWMEHRRKKSWWKKLFQREKPHEGTLWIPKTDLMEDGASESDTISVTEPSVKNGSVSDSVPGTKNDPVSDSDLKERRKSTWHS